MFPHLLASTGQSTIERPVAKPFLFILSSQQQPCLVSWVSGPNTAAMKGNYLTAAGCDWPLGKHSRNCNNQLLRSAAETGLQIYAILNYCPLLSPPSSLNLCLDNNLHRFLTTAWIQLVFSRQKKIWVVGGSRQGTISVVSPICNPLCKYTMHSSTAKDYTFQCLVFLLLLNDTYSLITGQEIMECD